MRFTVTRAASLLGLSAVIGGFSPAAAHAQLARSRSNQKVLVLWPLALPPRATDSVFLVQLGDQIREKLDGKERLRMNVMTRAGICEVLMASGFRCPEPLDQANADRLAEFIKADAYMIGWVTRNSAPTIHLRMVDLRKTGISGWITIKSDTSWKVDRFAEVVVDSIDSQLRAAESVRDCYDRLDHNDLKGAREKVADAFKLYPNHPAAGVCLARMFDAQHAPVDSIIFAFEKVVHGDSVNAKAWDRLAGAYQEKNDMQRAVEARTHQLEASPENSVLRTQVAAGWIQLKQYQKGVDILDVGLQNNPLDLTALNIKQRACFEGLLWRCGLTALTALYDADTSFRGDSVLYAKAFGAAQTLNDTAAMLRWSGEGVKRLPNALTMWRMRASALTTAGRGDSAVGAYKRVLDYDSTNVSVLLIVTKSMVDGLVIDSLTPVDTAKLSQIDSYLARATRLAKDSVAARGTIGSLYALPGLLMASKKKSSTLYVPWLEKAITYPVQPRTLQQADFYLAIVYLNEAIALDPQIQALGHPTPARVLTAAENAKACGLVAQEEVSAGKAKQAMTIGQPTYPPAAASVLGGANQFLTKNIPQYKTFFKCH